MPEKIDLLKLEAFDRKAGYPGPLRCLWLNKNGFDPLVESRKVKLFALFAAICLVLMLVVVIVFFTTEQSWWLLAINAVPALWGMVLAVLGNTAKERANQFAEALVKLADIFQKPIEALWKLDLKELRGLAKNILDQHEAMIGQVGVKLGQVLDGGSREAKYAGAEALVTFMERAECHQKIFLFWGLL